MAKTVDKGRCAKTGQFVSIEYAQKHPSTTVVEKGQSWANKTQKVIIKFRMCLDDVNRLDFIF